MEVSLFLFSLCFFNIFFRRIFNVQRDFVLRNRGASNIATFFGDSIVLPSVEVKLHLLIFIM
jgi:hypothetical protein